MLAGLACFIIGALAYGFYLERNPREKTELENRGVRGGAYWFEVIVGGGTLVGGIIYGVIVGLGFV